MLERGFEALGLRTAPNSQAINSQGFEGRAPCILDGWCDAGCPIGALANPLVLQWPRALRAGARLRHHAEVIRIATDASGGGPRASSTATPRAPSTSSPPVS